MFKVLECARIEVQDTILDLSLHATGSAIWGFHLQNPIVEVIVTLGINYRIEILAD
jgi:hypothetical protein